jgi:hypothetical protein
MPPMDPRDYADMTREALQAREDEWARRMIKVYEPLRTDLIDRVRLLKKKLPRAPLELRASYTWQLERFSSILRQVESEEMFYARKAANTTAGAQAANIQAAVNDLGVLTHSMAIPWTALPVQALERLVGFMENGTALQQHFRVLGAERYDALQQTLFKGMALGHSPNHIAQDLVGVVEEFTRRRATLIVRQESVRAYRESNIQSYLLNSGLVDGWTWLCLLSPRSCIACIALDGTFHPLSEPFGSHVSCRCIPVPHLVIDGPLLRKTGAEWFAKQPPHVQEQILGKAKYRLYRNGDLSLSAVVDRHHSEWGPTANIKSVKQLVTEGSISTQAASFARIRVEPSMRISIKSDAPHKRLPSMQVQRSSAKAEEFITPYFGGKPGAGFPYLTGDAQRFEGAYFPRNTHEYLKYSGAMYDGMDHQVANVINQELLPFFKECDRLRIPRPRGIIAFRDSAAAEMLTGDGYIYVNVEKITNGFLATKQVALPVNDLHFAITSTADIAKDGKEAFRTMLWHEFGHHVQQQYGVTNAAELFNPVLEQQARALYNKGVAGPTHYSKAGQDEFFAESYVMYQRYGGNRLHQEIVDMFKKAGL